jgi:hypothetical protein
MWVVFFFSISHLEEANRIFFDECYGLSVCVHQNLYVTILTPKMMVLGDRTFGKWLNHEGGSVMIGISAQIKETLKSSLFHFTFWGHHEKVLPTNQKAGPHWTPNLFRDAISDFLASGNKFLLFVNYLVCGVLLKQPGQMLEKSS